MFAYVPACYRETKGNGYNGGGWISSLQAELLKRPEVELAIAFKANGFGFKEKHDNVTYYPVPFPKKTWREKWNYFFHYSLEEEMHELKELYRKVVDDYRPDVIHVFGSESEYGMVATVTNIPLVLHIQGVIIPCQNAFMPPAVSRMSYLTRSWHPLRILKSCKELMTWKRTCVRERAVLQATSNFIGRTEWDHHIVDVFHPGARYFEGWEILRPSFYSAPQRQMPDRLTIVSTMSGVTYKGLDLVLKTADTLKNIMHMDFDWLVYGDGSLLPFFERLTGIGHTQVGIRMMGIGSEQDVCNALVRATVFAQTSYIDNSPNAVCEAQLVGCPVVATNVGGVSSLMEHGRTGFLVPANDPYQMAWHIARLHRDRPLNESVSAAAKQLAQKRHDRDSIVEGLMAVYREVSGTPSAD